MRIFIYIGDTQIYHDLVHLKEAEIDKVFHSISTILIYRSYKFGKQGINTRSGGRKLVGFVSFTAAVAAAASIRISGGVVPRWLPFAITKTRKFPTSARSRQRRKIKFSISQLPAGTKWKRDHNVKLYYPPKFNATPETKTNARPPVTFQVCHMDSCLYGNANITIPSSYQCSNHTNMM